MHIYGHSVNGPVLAAKFSTVPKQGVSLGTKKKPTKNSPKPQRFSRFSPLRTLVKFVMVFLLPALVVTWQLFTEEIDQREVNGSGVFTHLGPFHS